jgi:hypothetical protein
VDDRAGVRNLSLTKIGAVCGVLTTASFFVGIVLVASSGVQVLIPETGKDGLDWIADVDSASGLFFAGAWLLIIGGVFALVAFIGFYEPLRDAGPAMILAPVLGAAGMVLVTISHLIPIALGYEFVPGYVDASAASKASLEVTFDTFAATSLALNYVGDILVWGVVTPLFAYAALKTRVVPRWIGWLGIFGVGLFAGLLGAFAPASSIIDGLTFIGFVAFFVFMASMGVALLRRSRGGAVA